MLLELRPHRLSQAKSSPSTPPATPSRRHPLPRPRPRPHPHHLRHQPQALQLAPPNRDRFDGVIVHGLWKYPGLAAWLALAGHKPYVVFTHGMLDPYFKRAFPLKHIKKLASTGTWPSTGFSAPPTASSSPPAKKRDLAEQSFWLCTLERLRRPLRSLPPAQRRRDPPPRLLLRLP